MLHRQGAALHNGAYVASQVIIDKICQLPGGGDSLFGLFGFSLRRCANQGSMPVGGEHMNPLVKFSLFAVCAAAMQAALAAPVTFSFSGVPDGPLGTEFRGTIVYETAAPFAGNFANGIAGYSDAVLSATVSVGSFNWTLGPQPTFLGGIDSPQLFVGNHNTVGDEVTFQFGLVGPNVSFNGGSLRPSYVILRFVGDASVLPSNAIPENPLVLNGFSQNQGGFVFQPLGSDGTPMNSVSTLAFADNLTVTVASPIPEPETYGLLLAGLGLLGFEARRRRSLLAKP